ncbi:MAG: hypothetical protein H7Y32_01275, partial [Chloroflexales bacterium]|nr:hypothetical protein [Chloroflexales bacterium]
PLASTPLTATPLAATPVMTPRALPATNTSDGGLEALLLLFAVGLLIVSTGWALLGVRRR